MKHIHATLCLGILIASGCASGPGSVSQSAGIENRSAREWTVRGNIPLKQFVIHSHRGAGEMAPENTITAFELGWKLGTVPEADIRTTKDGVIVAFHDANFKRTVFGADEELKNKGVEDLTYAELSRLDVGGWMGERYAGLRVPTMAEVFDRLRARPRHQLCIDFKHVDLVQLAGLVRKHGVEKQVVLATTDYEIIRKWKQLLPKGETLLWMAGTEEHLKGRVEKLRSENFAGITHFQFHPRENKDKSSPEPFTISRAFLRASGDEVRRHGILYQAFPRGITDPKLYWQLLDLGVASFSTDHPELAIAAVREYYARR
jgi:glycerophosphoryl diester phosphodiesterase